MNRCLSIFAWFIFNLAWLSVGARACIWVNGTTLDGMPKRYAATVNVEWLMRALRETPGGQLERLIHSTQGASNREEEAVRTILSGDAPSGIRLLLTIEEETPGKYSTAANLGTAYELAGDNRNALKWIAEGIERNPDSHNGTEWLHALILETKLRLEEDPGYLKSHRIIPLPEAFGMGTMVEAGGKDRSILEILYALNYQLRERVLFVKAPDPVVADLMFTYALVEAHTGVVENAARLLKISKEYGFQDPVLLAATEKQFGTALWRGRILLGAAIIIAVVATILILRYCYRRKWFFLTPGQRRRYLESKKAAL